MKYKTAKRKDIKPGQKFKYTKDSGVYTALENKFDDYSDYHYHCFDDELGLHYHYGNTKCFLCDDDGNLIPAEPEYLVVRTRFIDKLTIFSDPPLKAWQYASILIAAYQPDANWLAVDKNGEVYTYKEEPYRAAADSKFWESEEASQTSYGIHIVTLPKALMEDIDWRETKIKIDREDV